MLNQTMSNGDAQTASGIAAYRTARELGSRSPRSYAAIREPNELVVIYRFSRSSDANAKSTATVVTPDGGNVLGPAAMSTLLRDARCLAKNWHPNIARVRHVERSGDDLVVATELVDGVTLADMFAAAEGPRPPEKDEPLLPLPILVRVLVDVVAGLSGLHGLRDDAGAPLGAIHGALCPANIAVGKDGVARMLNALRPRPPRMAVDSDVISYAAPEVLDVDVGAEPDLRADLHAVGVIMWEALTGRRLYEERDPARVLARQREEDVAPPSFPAGSPFAGLADVAMRAIAFDPSLRFKTAAEMGAALRSVAGTRIATGSVVAACVADLAGDRIRARRAELDPGASSPRRLAAEPETPGGDAPPSSGRAVAAKPRPSRQSEHDTIPPETKDPIELRPPAVQTVDPAVPARGVVPPGVPATSAPLKVPAAPARPASSPALVSAAPARPASSPALVSAAPARPASSPALVSAASAAPASSPARQLSAAETAPSPALASAKKTLLGPSAGSPRKASAGRPVAAAPPAPAKAAVPVVRKAGAVSSASVKAATPRAPSSPSLPVAAATAPAALAAPAPASLAPSVPAMPAPTASAAPALPVVAASADIEIALEDDVALAPPPLPAAKVAAAPAPPPPAPPPVRAEPPSAPAVIVPVDSPPVFGAVALAVTGPARTVAPEASYGPMVHPTPDAATSPTASAPPRDRRRVAALALALLLAGLMVVGFFALRSPARERGPSSANASNAGPSAQPSASPNEPATATAEAEAEAARAREAAEAKAREEAKATNEQTTKEGRTEAAAGTASSTPSGAVSPPSAESTVRATGRASPAGAARVAHPNPKPKRPTYEPLGI
jgi:eukaryotic-like serine/threonine-protein kinase